MASRWTTNGWSIARPNRRSSRSRRTGRSSPGPRRRGPSTGTNGTRSSTVVWRCCSPELTDAVARAATRRVAYFATNNEFGDWDTVHHTLAYANAAHELASRTDTTEVYRACFDGAMSVYLDRFLNSPRAPVPAVESTDRDPAAIRSELLSCFDRQGAVERVARLVVEHFELGGDQVDLQGVLGRALLRGDAGFHTLQNVGAAFRRADALEDEAEQRMSLVAGARYLAVHSPTRRENEQTFSIAARLHRGVRLHEAE